MLYWNFRRSLISQISGQYEFELLVEQGDYQEPHNRCSDLAIWLNENLVVSCEDLDVQLGVNIYVISKVVLLRGGVKQIIKGKIQATINEIILITKALQIIWRRSGIHTIWLVYLILVFWLLSRYFVVTKLCTLLCRAPSREVSSSLSLASSMLAFSLRLV